MDLKLHVNLDDPPTEVLIVAAVIESRNKNDVRILWRGDWKERENARLCDKNDKLLATRNNDINRYFARTLLCELYGGSLPCERTQVDHWMSFPIGPLTPQSLKEVVNYLERILLTQTWLVGKAFTLADIRIFCALRDEKFLEKYSEGYPNVTRWYKHISSYDPVKKTLELCPIAREQTPPRNENVRMEKTTEGTNTRKQEGKFIDLPGAEMGKVVVRFPPEASGYLHIGHAKAALLNQYYAEAFQGQLIMRFDDTNPAKETVEFEQAILEDLKLLQIKPDRFTHTSDYFNILEEYCTTLIKNGHAFVDDTPAHIMKEQRDQKLKSKNRDNSASENLELWDAMRRGAEKSQGCCVRAKIDYESANGCLRDPTIYRFKSEPHPRTENKYKVYPTYDFACPIVDSIENVTHTLRTMEYRDRDRQFFWILETLGLRKPYIWEYSRLNMTHTVLSKRKLTWFVEQGLVDGWDDPRFPTVRGILRRGMTIEGLKQFIIAQGSSKSVVFMQWDKIWALNKKIIDPIAIRYTALERDKTIPVDVMGAKEEWLTVQNHPKDPSKGTKQIRVGPKVLIERDDADSLVEGQNATFVNWGNLRIERIERKNGTAASVKASLNLEDKNYKNTLKITWLPAPLTKFDRNPVERADGDAITCYVVYFDHVMSIPVLGKDDDFKNFVAKDTRREVEMLGEVELKRAKKGEIIQLQRKGFFICDVPYAPVSSYSSLERPVILFHIPDGHMTASSTNPVAAVTASTTVSSVENRAKSGASDINEKIIAQGDRVRRLKVDKADKGSIDAEVKALLALKAEYKVCTGEDWKPGIVVAKASAQLQAEKDDARGIDEKIVAQGDKVRRLKADKADKGSIDAEVKALLALKAEYKVCAGVAWKPGIVVPKASAQLQAEQDDARGIDENIVAQGDKVRRLKADKADKGSIDAEVKALLALKAEYKVCTGEDWKPGIVVAKASAQLQAEKDDARGIDEKIVAQGDKVRRLKADKADKGSIDAEVKALLALKAEYKICTGEDWKLGIVVPKAPKAQLQVAEKNDSTKETPFDEIIQRQRDKVAELQKLLDQEVEKLQNLGIECKHKIGSDILKFYPAQEKQQECEEAAKSEVPPSLLDGKSQADRKGKNSKREEEECRRTAIANVVGGDSRADGTITNRAEEIAYAIEKQGDKVRSLKSSKADKNVIDREVKVLLDLKNDYKSASGRDWKPVATSGATSKKKKEERSVCESEKMPAKEMARGGVEASKTGTRLGLEAKKEENFFDWYSQIITKSGMIEYYDVSGCYILRPWSYAIWKMIKDYIDKEITTLGVQECYFPIFVTRAVLEKEKTHIADFAPEVAWVTKCGESDLAEPIAIRPTSETVMYPAYAKWLRSDTELPLRLNQWNNVVRWEFKDPKPFLRTREFLWQEGHTAFATKEEADREVLIILDMYARVYEDLLAVPVIKGRKTEKEKFAGGDYTTTVEAFISTSGRAIQGATSHHLGQNFSKMFNIQVEGATEGDDKTFVYQNSWGLTTRTIGVMIMVHGDDKGLVLPPNVASVQAIVVPCGITANTTVEQRRLIQVKCIKLVDDLSEEGKFKIKGDFRSNRTPGWKFNHWELKGVPVRIELGPKDLEKDQVTFVRRDNFQRVTAKRNEVAKALASLLNDIQSSLLNKARANLNAHIKQVENWDDFGSELNKKNLLLSPFCGEPTCEDNIKADSAKEDGGEEPGALSMGAKSLCIPFEQPRLTKALKCIHYNCGNEPKFYTLFGRSY